MTSSTIVRVIELIDTNKARMAFLVPLLLAVTGAVANWIITGEFDATEIRLAAGGAVLALGAGAGAYLAPAGNARVPIAPGDTLQRRRSDAGYSLIEVLAALFIALLIVIVLLALLDRL